MCTFERVHFICWKPRKLGHILEQLSTKNLNNPSKDEVFPRLLGEMGYWIPLHRFRDSNLAIVA